MQTHNSLDLKKKDIVCKVLEYCGNKAMPLSSFISLILSREDEVDVRFQNQVHFLLDGGKFSASVKMDLLVLLLVVYWRK